jgi:hypothetical protein
VLDRYEMNSDTKEDRLDGSATAAMNSGDTANPTTTGHVIPVPADSVHPKIPGVVLVGRLDVVVVVVVVVVLVPTVEMVVATVAMFATDHPSECVVLETMPPVTLKPEHVNKLVPIAIWTATQSMVFAQWLRHMHRNEARRSDGDETRRNSRDRGSRARE